jgi:PIN domain nuclease of toxin-antitoxin system
MDRDDPALGSRSRKLIEDCWGSDSVAVSAISFWEVAMLEQRERVVLPLPVEDWRADLLQSGLKELPLDGRTALLASGIQAFHKDPADRFIAASAILSEAVLLTADDDLLTWEGQVERQNARL